MSPHAPPRLATWLLRRRLPAEWREFVLGDLEEGFALRQANLRGARRWYWWQALRCVATPPPRHAGEPAAPPAPASGDPLMRTTLDDLRHAIRVLGRTPAFSLGVIVVLALGIGASAAIFTLVNAVLLRPLPFDRAGELVRLYHDPPQAAFPGIHRFSVSPANFYDWKRDARSFTGVALYRFRRFRVQGAAGAESVGAGAVGDGFFEVVGTPPALGRVFRPEEDTPAGSHVVILSDGFWTSRFGRAPDVVGRTLRLDGEPYTIVGVMPARFTVPAWGITDQDVWVPIGYTDAERAVRDNHNASVIARLGPGVDVAGAQAEMDLLSDRLAREHPAENQGWGAVVVPLQEAIVGDVRSWLLVLLGAVGLLLLIACANAANLMFARALARRKELAIRSALGAGRARVFRQLLAEALVLALAGGGAGLALAYAGLRAGAALLSGQVPRADEVSIDGRVMAFVLAVSSVSAVLAGALPAIRAGRTELTDALKSGGRGDGVVGLRTRRLLIVCEVGLSVVLLAGALLLGRSLLSLHQVDAGFDPRQVLTLEVELPDSSYDTPGKRRSFTDALVQRVAALPGVEAAGAADTLPLLGGSVQPVVLDGRPELTPRDQPAVSVRKATPGFLAAMRIRLLRGRDLAWTDTEGLLVSRGAARMLWGDADPIGKRVTLPLESPAVLKEVVGVVDDVRQTDLAAAPDPTIYEYTHAQASPSISLAIRTRLKPESLAWEAVAAVHALDAAQPVDSIRPMTAIVEETLTSQRLAATLLTLFAAVALTLAMVGIYSVLAYVVRGRSQEMAIRAALGARARDMIGLMVREGMVPTAIGVAAGLAAAIGCAGLLQSLVFGISASDPLTLAAVSAALLLAAFAASVVPARRAARVDPLTLLRPQ
jgi:predicted permease